MPAVSSSPRLRRVSAVKDRVIRRCRQVPQTIAQKVNATWEKTKQHYRFRMLVRELKARKAFFEEHSFPFGEYFSLAKSSSARFKLGLNFFENVWPHAAFNGMENQFLLEASFRSAEFFKDSADAKQKAGKFVAVLKQLRRDRKHVSIITLLDLFRRVKGDFGVFEKKGSYHRLVNILNEPFPFQRIEDYLASMAEHKTARPERIIKEKDNLGLIGKEMVGIARQDNVVLRVIDKEQYAIWKQLYEEGLNVEPILPASSDIAAETKLKPRRNQVFVKSKVVGRTLADLIHSRNLDRTQVRAIARQMMSTMVKVWKHGYVHKHPHLFNWCVEFEGAHPKVTLIDFSLVKQASGRGEIMKDIENFSSKLSEFQRMCNQFVFNHPQNEKLERMAFG
ncbi:MAG: hypothetical protein AABW72_05425 [archaeon]|mgnify:CR=1 FL=1